MITGVRAASYRASAAATTSPVGVHTSAISTTSNAAASFASVSSPLTVGKRVDLDAPTRGQFFSFELEGFDSLPANSTVRVQVLACAATSKCKSELLLEGSATSSDWTVDFGEAVSIGRVVVYGDTLNATAVRMQRAAHAAADLANDANFFKPILAYELPAIRAAEGAAFAFAMQSPVMGEGVRRRSTRKCATSLSTNPLLCVSVPWQASHSQRAATS